MLTVAYVNSQCPPEIGEKDELLVHLPHETVCTMYYKCNYGEKVLQDCPPGQKIVH